MKNKTKYIFVTGGVLSGLGKGITAASIGALLKARGLRVNIQKCDPYLNADAGLLSPREHGETYVTKDGAETDLDLGHYERFIDEELTQSSSLMSGRVLRAVFEDERAGRYNGQTVQIIPHVTNAIQTFIASASEGYDVHIVEIGGTVGDYESLSFIEAIREFGLRQGRDNVAYVHVVYLPYLGASKETKTKPAQNSVRELRGLGIIPDILVARSEKKPASANIIDKLSMFCGVSSRAIALLPNAETIYEVPLSLEASGVIGELEVRLGLKAKKPNLKSWQSVVDRATKKHSRNLRIAMVAKYLDNQDTYMSVLEAIKAAAWQHDVGAQVDWLSAEKITDDNVEQVLGGYDGILVPGGFGKRGIEGKITAAKYALGSKKPYLGLCLGMQVAVIAAARKAGLSKANSTEFDKAALEPVIIHIDGQKNKMNTGGSMRLGNYDCQLEIGSLARKLYGATKTMERHRHRLEVNNDYLKDYEGWGIRASGINPDSKLVEIIEGIDHPFFVGCQFHPEYRSRPNRPHPLIDGFIAAASHKL